MPLRINESEKGTESFIENFIKWAKTEVFEFGKNYEVSWMVLLDKQATIAFEDPAPSFLRMKVDGRIQTEIPDSISEVNDDGCLESPLFPILNRSVKDSDEVQEIDPKNARNYSETLTECMVKVDSLSEVSLPNQEEIEALLENANDPPLRDAFGHPVSEFDSHLAVKAAKETLNSYEDNPDSIDFAISFDVLQKLLVSFHYKTELIFEEDGDNESAKVPFNREFECEWKPESSIPVAEKIYLHEHERVLVSDYEVEKSDIRAALQNQIVSAKSQCLIEDPADRGVPAAVGRIVQVNSEGESHFYSTSEDVDVSLVHTFWTVLDIEKYRYISNDILENENILDSLQDKFTAAHLIRDGITIWSKDPRRDIIRRIEISGYWAIKGKNYRNKGDFKEDLQKIQSILEDILEIEVQRHSFGGKKISKTPIEQKEIINQICDKEEDSGDGQPGQVTSPQELDCFVADTNVIDAGVISELVSSGPLYGSKVILPDVVLQEVHGQADADRQIGSKGLSELETLRNLDENGLITLEIATTEITDVSDNVAVDHEILNIALQRDVPLCSDDETLLRLGKISGATTFRLNQKVSQPERLVKEVLSREQGIPIIDLAESVSEKRREVDPSQPDEVNSAPPMITPSEDVESKLQLKSIIKKLEHQNEVYRLGSTVGLVSDVGIIPELSALVQGVVSQAIENQIIIDELQKSKDAYHINVAVPAFLTEWVDLRGSGPLQQELSELEGLDEKNKIDLDLCEPKFEYSTILGLDREYVERALEGLVTRNKDEYDYMATIRLREQSSEPEIEFINSN